MPNINTVIVAGHLGKDPERKEGENQPVRFSIAVNERWKDGAGEKQERTNWFNVVCWNGQGDSALQYLKAGSPVLIEGSLRSTSWDDKESGQKRYGVEIVAARLHFLGQKPKEKPERKKKGA